MMLFYRGLFLCSFFSILLDLKISLLTQRVDFFQNNLLEIITSVDSCLLSYELDVMSNNIDQSDKPQSFQI